MCPESAAGRSSSRRSWSTLKAIIGLAVETSLPLIEAGRHDLAVRIAPEPLPVMADATRLAQVFSNLLNNAAKYTPDGGRLPLVARRDGARVQVAVTDNGVGIPSEMLPEVFEMFSQVGRNLDRAQGGLGIGLTLVRRLTEMHGGEVSAHSHGTGTGSTFVVRIPLAPVPVSSAHPDAMGQRPGRGRRRNTCACWSWTTTSTARGRWRCCWACTVTRRRWRTQVRTPWRRLRRSARIWPSWTSACRV